MHPHGGAQARRSDPDARAASDGALPGAHPSSIRPSQAAGAGANSLAPPVASSCGLSCDESLRSAACSALPLLGGDASATCATSTGLEGEAGRSPFRSSCCVPFGARFSAELSLSSVPGGVLAAGSSRGVMRGVPRGVITEATEPNRICRSPRLTRLVWLEPRRSKSDLTRFPFFSVHEAESIH